MQNKGFKKGFTLVELVVVVAVIAILAAVLIPTYTNLVKKANISIDSQLVKNLNDNMALYEVDHGKPKTAHDAFVSTEDFGFIIEKLTPTSNGNDIVWDMTTNRFALIDAIDVEKVIYSDPTKTLSTNPIDLWKVSKTVPTSSKYSVYLAGTSIETAIPSLGVGVDVGRNTGVPSIAYTNLNASKGTNIVFRTDSGFTKLVINAPNDDVALFGQVGDVDVQAVKKGTLDIHGRVGGVLTLVYGKINVSSQGVVGVIVANPANSSDVEMSAQPGASIGKIISNDETLVNTLASSVSVAVPQVKTEVVSEEDMETVLTSVAYIKGTTNRYFDSIQAAINAANGTTNIVLMKDFLFDNVTGPALSVPNGADIVLDLNGKIIQGYLNNTSSSTLITLGGASNTLETKLTIKDSTAPANGIGSGMLYVLNRYASDPMNVATSVIEINPKATVTIESGKLVNDAIVGNPGEGYGMYAVDVRTNGGESRDSKLIVKGGLLQSTNYRAVRAFANAQNSTIHLTIEGGKVYSPNNNAIWLQNKMHSYPDPVILKITGGVIESAGYINGVDRTPLNIGSEDGLTKTITGGTFIQNGLNVSSTYIVS